MFSKEPAIKFPKRISDRLMRVITMMSILNGIYGCGLGDPNPFYSGDFAVSSENARKIQVKDWSNFGGAQPMTGYISREGPKSSDFPKLDRIPESTVVSWVFDDDEDGPVHSQAIDLRGVVPKNIEGRTEFTFGEDGIWSVKFIPEVK